MQKNNGVTFAKAHVRLVFSKLETVFLDRLRKVREQLTPPGKPLLSHHEFMLAMFDVVEMHTPEPATDSSTPSSTMLRNGGMAYITLVKND